MQDPLKQALLRYNQNLPRYTSYPPANFMTAVEHDTLHRSWLSALPPGSDISLYVHIPFCPQMCWFCGCHTQATTRYEPVSDYLDLLAQEIALVGDLLPPGTRVAHIHFGGGSPTMLSPDDFERVMTILNQNLVLTSNCPVAIEIDPRQVTHEKIQTYAACGVQRVSLGVQDINPRVMQAINRIQPFDVTVRAVEWCHQAGLDHINIDLVYGLPHQTVSGIMETARAVCSLTPQRLALFGYAHVPWMKKHMRLIAEDELPDSGLRYDLFMAGSEVIEACGLSPIGIDHFAQPSDDLAQSALKGTMKRNFQGYVPAGEDLPIIGLGVSSISQLPQGLVQNTPHRPHYRDSLAAGHLPTRRVHALTPEDKIRGSIIEELMCTGQINGQIFDQNTVGLDLSYERRLLQSLIDDGLVGVGRTGQITAHHRLAIRMVAAIFDQYRQQVLETTGQRHAVAV